MSDKPENDQTPPDIPGLFATIHFRSAKRPDGYTDEQIVELNMLSKKPKPNPRG